MKHQLALFALLAMPVACSGRTEEKANFSIIRASTIADNETGTLRETSTLFAKDQLIWSHGKQIDFLTNGTLTRKVEFRGEVGATLAFDERGDAIYFWASDNDELGQTRGIYRLPRSSSGKPELISKYYPWGPLTIVNNRLVTCATEKDAPGTLSIPLEAPEKAEFTRIDSNHCYGVVPDGENLVAILSEGGGAFMRTYLARHTPSDAPGIFQRIEGVPAASMDCGSCLGTIDNKVYATLGEAGSEGIYVLDGARAEKVVNAPNAYAVLAVSPSRFIVSTQATEHSDAGRKCEGGSVSLIDRTDGMRLLTQGVCEPTGLSSNGTNVFYSDRTTIQKEQSQREHRFQLKMTPVNVTAE